MEEYNNKEYTKYIRKRRPKYSAYSEYNKELNKETSNKEYEDKEWNKDETEKTLNDISYLYSDMLYEKDLFSIFKTVSIYEKHIICNESKGDLSIELRMEFIKSLMDMIKKFSEKYNGEIIYDNLSIKNKIMIVSIIRKTRTIIKGQGCNDLIDIDKICKYNIQI